MSIDGGAVEDFLELEAELTDGAKNTGTYEQGNIAKAAKIPTPKVPDDYPVSIHTRQALHFDIETPDSETIAAYIEWPEEDEDSDHVERLLDALGRDAEEFANIYGDRVALDSEDGWHTIDTERTAALRRVKEASEDGSLDRSRDLLGGALVVAALGYVANGLGLELVGGPLVLLAFVAVPGLFYRDAKWLRGLSERKYGWQWLLSMAMPIFHVGIGFAYLVGRRLYLSESTPGGDSALVTAASVLGIGTFVVGIASRGAVLHLGTALSVYGWSFLSALVYIDSEYVNDTTDSEWNGGLWTAFTALTGPIGASAYLLNRRSELA